MENICLLYSVYDFGKLCKASYDKNFICYHKIRNKYGLDCNFVIDEKNKYLKIVFVGTNEKKDWLSNLNFRKHYFNEKEYIHNGCYEMFQESVKDIYKVLKEIDFKKLIILGHSLGGYLAQMMAYDLFKKYQIKSNVFIFGSGLVISKEIQKMFWKNNILIFEIRLKKDIVPKLLKCFYKSYYTIKINVKNKKTIMCNINFVKNHLMISYIESLEEILN